MFEASVKAVEEKPALKGGFGISLEKEDSKDKSEDMSPSDKAYLEMVKRNRELSK